MANWLYITNAENWEVTKKTNIIGVADRYKTSLSRLKIGDKCLIYVKGNNAAKPPNPAIVVGESEVASEVYEDKKQIFKSLPGMEGEKFSARLNLRRLTPTFKSVPFKPLVPSLSFIKNKKAWGATLQGKAVLSISEQDYRIIVSLF